MRLGIISAPLDCRGRESWHANFLKERMVMMLHFGCVSLDASRSTFQKRRMSNCSHAAVERDAQCPIWHRFCSRKPCRESCIPSTALLVTTLSIDVQGECHWVEGWQRCSAAPLTSLAPTGPDPSPALMGLTPGVSPGPAGAAGDRTPRRWCGSASAPRRSPAWCRCRSAR